MLVDNGAVVNILSASVMKKLHKDERDLIPTNVIVSDFSSRITQIKGVLPIELPMVIWSLHFLSSSDQMPGQPLAMKGDVDEPDTRGHAPRSW